MVEEAQYGDLQTKSKTIDVTAQLVLYLKTLPVAGTKPSQFIVNNVFSTNLIASYYSYKPLFTFSIFLIFKGGKHMFFSLPKGSKNALPGIADPARGLDKKLRMILLVDGCRVSKTINEYDPFYIASGTIWCLRDYLLHTRLPLFFYPSYRVCFGR